MNMKGGDDCLPHLVLNGVEFIGKFPHVVIVDEGHRADGLLVRFPFGLDEKIANQIPQGFGPVAVTLLFDEPVKTFQ